MGKEKKNRSQERGSGGKDGGEGVESGQDVIYVKRKRRDVNKSHHALQSKGNSSSCHCESFQDCLSVAL